MKYAIAGCLLIASMSSCIAGNLISQPEATIYLNSASYDAGNPSYSAVMGDFSVADPTWAVSQWGNPMPIGAPSQSGQYQTDYGNNWTVANASTGIHFFADPDTAQGILSNTYQLSQNGHAQTPLPCGQEYDLLLSPTAPQSYKIPGTTQYAASRFANSGTLNALSTITVNVGLNVAYERNYHSCPVNTVSYNVGVLLTSSNGSSMIWRLILRNSTMTSSYNLSCLNYPVSLANGQQKTCFHSTIDRVSPGQVIQCAYCGRVAYSVDVLPAILAVLPYAGDTNAADWRVTGLYVGNIMHGGMISTANWDSVMLTAY